MAVGSPNLTKESFPLITLHRMRESQQTLTILLAEDNLINQKLAVRLLEKWGHRVRTVENGREVLEALEKERFDLILRDVQMPKIDGLEATRIIRKNEETRNQHIPIIAITAHAMKGFKELCLEAGMDDYISKPFDPQEVKKIIESYIPKYLT
jgi:CheY-like chemotaxis protein